MQQRKSIGSLQKEWARIHEKMVWTWGAKEQEKQWKICDNVIEVRRPDIILIDKKDKKKDNYRYSSSSWYKSREKGKGENENVSGLKERYQKIVKI